MTCAPLFLYFIGPPGSHRGAVAPEGSGCLSKRHDLLPFAAFWPRSFAKSKFLLFKTTTAFSRAVGDCGELVATGSDSSIRIAGPAEGAPKDDAGSARADAEAADAAA